MVPETVDRKLAAILSADAVGYSRLMAADEASTIRTLRDSREVIATLIRQHRGRVVDSPGDNVLAEFPTALEAVRCATELQGVLGVRNAGLPAERRMEFRIGVHMGDVAVEGARLYGDGVNIAARLERLADAGGICISATVHEQVRNRLDVVFEDLGDRAVKNIPDQVHVYRVRLERPLPPQAATVPRSTRAAGRRWAVALAVVVIAVIVGWRLFERTSSPIADPGEIRSLAVLPLENLSGDPEQEYFADGMTDALIADLAQLGALRVISRTSVMQYKGARKPAREIAAELGVDALVEGSVIREGDRVRITAQLIDARSDTHLWVDRYDRDLRGVLALQSEVAREIARQIRIEMSPRDAARLASPRAVDPRAHDAYLRGIYQIGQLRPEAVRQAIVHFEEATRIDPDYAQAYASIARAYSLLTSPLGAIRGRESMPRARAAALKALEIDPTLGEAHAALAQVEYFHDWDWVGAEEEFERALELSPNDAYGRLSYGFYLATMRRFDESLRHAEMGVRLAPFDLVPRVAFSFQLAFAGKLDRAVEEAKKIIELDPTFPRGHWAAGRFYQWMGRVEESVRADLRFHELSGVSEERRAAMKRAFETSGPRGYHRLILETLTRSESVGPYRMAIAHHDAGDFEGALQWLERAYEERDAGLVYMDLLSMQGLRSDPRFVALVRRVGLPEG